MQLIATVRRKSLQTLEFSVTEAKKNIRVDFGGYSPSVLSGLPLNALTIPLCQT